MEVQHFFDPATSTLTYVVHDGTTGVVIDPVLDYEPKSARTSTKSAAAVHGTSMSGVSRWLT